MHRCRARGIALLLGVVLGFIEASAQEGPVELRLRLEKGDVYRQRLKTEQVMTTGGNAPAGRVAQTMTVEYTQRVEDVDQAGVARIASTYDVIRFSQESSAQKLVFDSSDAAASNHPMGKAFGALVGVTVTARIHPDGDVSDVCGMDEVAERVVAGMGIEEGPARDELVRQIEQVFGEQAFGEGMQRFLKVYPPRPVSAGDTWSTEETVVQGFPVDVSSTYRVKERANGVIVFDVTGAVTSDPRSCVTRMGAIQVRCDLTGAQTGTLRIDENDGMVLYSAWRQTLSGALVPLDTPEAGGLPIDIESTVTFETTR